MTRNIKILISTLASALGILLGVGGHEYVQQARALATADAHAQDQEAIIKQKADEMAATQRRLDERDRAWNQREKEFDAERAEVRSVPTAQHAIATVAPTAKLVELRREDLPPAAAAQLPDAPSYALMTANTAVELGRVAVDFKQCTAQVEKLTADNSDLTSEVAAAQASQAAALSEAREWQKAAKGSVARRVKTAGKWTAIGAAAGVLAYRFVAH